MRFLATANELWGIDNDAVGLESLRKRGVPNLLTGDVYNLFEVEIPGNFDLIIAGELIEHLDNPGVFLDQLVAAFGPETTLALTTPNAYSIEQWVHMLLSDHAVDPKHVGVYGFSTLSVLLSCRSLEVRAWLMGTNTQLIARSRIATSFEDLGAKPFPALADSHIVTVRKWTA